MALRKLVITIIYGLAVAVVLAGCVTVEMTPEAKVVRETTNSKAEDCDHLGRFDSRVPDSADATGTLAQIQARNHVRKEGAELGGNAYTVSNVTPVEATYIIQYNAYRCTA